MGILWLGEEILQHLFHFFPGEMGLQLPVEQITQLLGERTAESQITLDLLWASPVTLSKISTSFKQPLCPSHLDLKTWSYILKSCYAAFTACRFLSTVPRPSNKGFLFLLLHHIPMTAVIKPKWKV